MEERTRAREGERLFLPVFFFSSLLESKKILLSQQVMNAFIDGWRDEDIPN